MKKSSFWTFCFSFLPGCGQLYLGMMKRGLFLLCLFWGDLALMNLLMADFFGWFLPIIWFFSFFDALNAKWMSPEERQALDNRIDLNFLSIHLPNTNLGSILSKHPVVIGSCTIFVGLYLLLINFIRPMIRGLMDYLGYDFWLFDNALRSIPSLIISVAIIWFGIRLIRGKKSPAPEEDYVEFKGESNE